jgi:uncharacterized protein YdeI (YjbR/CyaY-like superfamily)
MPVRQNRAMSKFDDAPEVLAEDRATWRAWLQANHATADGVWLVGWRKGTGKPTLAYEEAVEEALCFGWIDSTGGIIDEQRSRQWYAPRRKGSGWAATNKARIERLERAGLMTPAGRAVIDAAKADGSWTLLDAVERLEVPPDLAAAFDAHPPARQHWDAFPRSPRRAILQWIAEAKRPETRQKRIETTATRAARNERAQGY